MVMGFLIRRSKMSRAGFIVAFEGPSVADGTIDVRDLAPALLSIGKAIDAANRALNGPDVPVRVEVKTVAPGCFEVDLNVVLPTWEQLRTFVLGGDVQAANTILSLLGFAASSGIGLIALYRWLAGRSAQHGSQQESVIILELDGRVIEVPIQVMRLYQDIAVNRAMSELLTSLETPNLDRIEFREVRGAPSVETLTREDRTAFTLPEAEPEVVIDDTRRLALSIRSLAFQEGNKWRLFDGQNVITATIEDRDFLSAVDRNELSFRKGDVLICSVRTIQRQGASGLITEHAVLKVIEHKIAATQIPLPLPKPPSADGDFDDPRRKQS